MVKPKEVNSLKGIELLAEEKNRSWDTVISPIKGCKFKCDYCYMHKIEADMKPRFDVKQLDCLEKTTEKLKVFLGGAGDAWGEFIKSQWIQKVLDYVEKNQCKHDFMFITKNPKRYADFEIPRHAWVGTTDDGIKCTKNNVEILRQSTTHNRFVSFEPLMEKPNVDLRGISWVIVGADLTEGALPPPKTWVKKIIKEARELGIPIWLNDSLNYDISIKEFPKAFLSNTNPYRFRLCEKNKNETIYEDKKFRVRERIDCGMVHLSIARKDGQCIHDWRELQKIKNEIVGCEREAVEIYPNESRVLDARNSFHLWVLDIGVKVPFGFDGRVVVDSESRFNQRPFNQDEAFVPMKEVIKRVAHGGYKETANANTALA